MEGPPWRKDGTAAVSRLEPTRFAGGWCWERAAAVQSIDLVGPLAGSGRLASACAA